MQMSRTLALWGSAMLALVVLHSSAVAQTYPDKTIRLIVGFPAGQASDTTARTIAAKMGEFLKQSIFVDNRPGAGGGISHEAAKNSTADGYTLLMGSTGTLAINPSLYRKLGYDPLKDFQPIGTVAASPLALVTTNSTPVKNVKEMIAYVKSRPGKASYASPGNGTTANIAMEMLKQLTGMDLLHVPYKGSPPMITDMIGGQPEFAFDATTSIVPIAQSGRVRLLGVTSIKRMSTLPDVPTIAEQGVPGFEALAWTGMMAPKGTPPAIVEKLNAALNKALKDPAVVAEFSRNGSYALGGTPAEFQRFLLSETERWGKAVKASGAQID